MADPRSRLGKHVAQSGMTDVYKVKGRRGWRAIKVTRADKPEYQDTLLNEAMVLHELGPRPNIISFHDLGRIHGRIYIELEYLARGELGDLTPFPLPEREALRITRGMARALAHAHEQGYVHGDVKPENFWLGLVPKLFDFGIAGKVGEKRGKENMLMGSPSFMTIFSLSGDPLSFTDDIFGLGVSLYEMLTDRSPFDFVLDWDWERTIPLDNIKHWFHSHEKLAEKILGMNIQAQTKVLLLKSLDIMLPVKPFPDGRALDSFMDGYFPDV
jgi:serine/threonine protein kinase